MASTAAISKILNDMITAIDTGKFQGIDRKKNLDTLAHLGISWEVAKEEIYDLTEADYRRGPMVDNDDFASDLFWEFKKTIDGCPIYIKFKVVYQEDNRVKVVSFHIDGA